MLYILKFKFIFIYLIILFTSINTTFSQSLLKSVAGKDYLTFSQDPNYDVSIYDSIIVITDAPIETMLFSLKDFKFIRRTGIYYPTEHDYYYPVGALNSGKEILTISNYGLESYIIDLQNISEEKTSSMILKDSLFEVDLTKSRKYIKDNNYFYIEGKNKLNKKDTISHILCIDLLKRTTNEIIDPYIQKYKKVPTYKFTNNLYMKDDFTLLNLNNSQTFSISSLNKDKAVLYYNFRQMDFLSNENAIVATSNMLYNDTLGIKLYSGFFILDTNLKKINNFYTLGKVTQNSYNSKERQLYFTNILGEFCIFDFMQNQIVEKYKIENPNAKNLPTIVNYLKENLVLISTLGDTYTSYIYDFKKKIIVQNLHNDLYNIKKIEISNDDKYIAALGNNFILNIYDTTFKLIKTIGNSNNFLKLGKTTYKELGIDFKFSKDNELLFGGSHIFDECYVFNTEKQSNLQTLNIRGATTVDWEKNTNKFVIGNNGGNIYLYEKKDSVYKLLKTKEHPNTNIFKVVYYHLDTIASLSYNQITKETKLLKWILSTDSEIEFNVTNNIYERIYYGDSTRSWVETSKNKDYIYQDLGGTLTKLFLNDVKYESLEYTINGNGRDESTRNYAKINSKDDLMYYSKRENQWVIDHDSYLRMYDLNKKKKVDWDTNNILFTNSYTRNELPTLQFCAYGLFNNSNKMVTGSFDGTLMLWDMNNIKMGVDYSEVQNPMVKIWNDESNIYLQNESENNYDYKIFDLNYKVLQNDKLESNSSNSININDRLSNNIYFVLITNKKSNQSQIYKFIIRN
ncbi:MAG: hypothetical protein NTW25_13135 [Candidatus Kapabacteria bacterium]|nr:hypothetical protein [Candidatus Kapabacteria bacterium]